MVNKSVVAKSNEDVYLQLNTFEFLKDWVHATCAARMEMLASGYVSGHKEHMFLPISQEVRDFPEFPVCFTTEQIPGRRAGRNI